MGIVLKTHKILWGKSGTAPLKKIFQALHVCSEYLKEKGSHIPWLTRTIKINLKLENYFVKDKNGNKLKILNISTDREIILQPIV